MATTSEQTSPYQGIEYPNHTYQRAVRAMRCAPFQLSLYTTMRVSSVALKAITGTLGVEKGYTISPRPELGVENDLLWLIQVGVLRREVDGQGITDSFRLTPLGRQVLTTWESRADFASPSAVDRFYNCLHRQLRFPL